MAYQAFKETYFKNMIKAAKAGKVAYAFGFDKDGGEHCFVLDDALDGKELFNKVKTEKGVTAGGYGTCTVQGTSFQLTPEKKQSGLKKMVVELAKSEGWAIKQVKVVGEEEEGNASESESESGNDNGNLQPAATPASNEDGNANEAETPESESQEENGDTGNAESEATESESDGSDLSPEQLRKQASGIRKGVAVWNKTTVAATKELRKLQKAILDLKDPRSAPVIKGLESILKRLDTVDEEAEAAASAAEAGDAAGFDKARDVLVAKLRNIQSYVETDELIKDADSNPLVDIKLSETLGASIKAILRVLA